MAQSLKKHTSSAINLINRKTLLNQIPQLGSNMFDKSFQKEFDTESSFQSLEMVKIEIKQLKRENAFLKAKIQELKHEKYPQKPQFFQRQNLNGIKFLNKKIPNKQVDYQTSLNTILKEIQSMLKLLASLHRIQTAQKQWNFNNLLEQDYSQEQDMIKVEKQNRQKLKKKLQKLPLLPEQLRFQNLLQIFTEFYKTKTFEENQKKQKIQKYIEKVISINKKIIQNIDYKTPKKTIMTTRYFTQYQTAELANIASQTNLHRNFVSKWDNSKNSMKHDLSYSTFDGLYGKTLLRR